MVAAPWRYALAAKLGRLMKPSGPARDYDDALTYIHEMIALREHRPVSPQDLINLGSEFKFTTGDEPLFRRLAQGYAQKYGSEGILLPGAQ